jgi:hypothetical protein
MPWLLRALASVIATALFAATPGLAQADAPVVTEYKVDAPQRLTIGDRVKVTIVVEADQGTRVEIAPGGIPEDLQLAESARFSSRSAGSGRIEVRIDLVVAPFVLGEYPMPPITLRYRDPTGSAGQLQTPASRLLIESTLSGPEPQPRDLKAQAEIGAPPAPPYELIALAAGAFVLAMGLLYVAWKRLQRVVPDSVASIEEEEEALGPEDSARRALDRAGARFAQDADLGPYYAVISATVRGYLTQRFGFPAFALTTAELQGPLAGPPGRRLAGSVRRGYVRALPASFRARRRRLDRRLRDHRDEPAL